LPKLELCQEYQDLEERLWALDRRLADALNRIKHASATAELEQARQDEQSVLTQLDRLMTRMRAVEGQLLQIAKDCQDGKASLSLTLKETSGPRPAHLS
jgi:predicted  nucleic acid-binding Zn-ribbon protein